MKKYSKTWFSPGFNTQISCPVDGCIHRGQVITKAHLKNEHDMTREEVVKKYGYPEINAKSAPIMNGSSERKWNSVSQTTDL